jgi:hypothetical protein
MILKGGMKRGGPGGDGMKRRRMGKGIKMKRGR